MQYNKVDFEWRVIKSFSALVSVQCPYRLAPWGKGYTETAEDGGAVVACSESQRISCSCSAGWWLYRLTQGFVLSANPIPVLSSRKKEVIKFQLAWVKQIIKEMESEKGCYCQVLKELIQWHLKNTRKKFGSIRKQVLYWRTVVLCLWEEPRLHSLCVKVCPTSPSL